MCVYSMVMDHYWEKWKHPPQPPQPTYPNPPTIQSQITPEEIEEFKELLRKAKEYDERTGQKDCELESKKEKLRKLAEEMGVEIEFP